MIDLRSYLQLSAVFVVGLAAGIWTVVAPWVVGYPTSHGIWTSPIWAATWVGAIVSIASGLGLVISLALATRELTRPQRPGAASRQGPA